MTALTVVNIEQVTICKVLQVESQELSLQLRPYICRDV